MSSRPSLAHPGHLKHSGFSTRRNWAVPSFEAFEALAHLKRAGFYTCRNRVVASFENTWRQLYSFWVQASGVALIFCMRCSRNEPDDNVREQVICHRKWITTECHKNHMHGKIYWKCATKVVLISHQKTNGSQQIPDLDIWANSTQSVSWHNLGLGRPQKINTIFLLQEKCPNNHANFSASRNGMHPKSMQISKKQETVPEKKVDIWAVVALVVLLWKPAV